MARTVTPDLSIVLTFLRRGQGWSQADLGEVSGISSTLLNDYERGRKNLTRQRLEHVVAFMGLPPEAIDRTLAALAAIRESGRTPGGPEDGGTPESRKIEALASRHGTAITGFLRSTLSMLTVEAEALHARQRARILWDHLKKRAPAERRSLVQAKLQYRSWALCERIAAESIQKAPNHPKEALELAELALLLAERAPGDQLWRLRLQGYAWAHVSNGRRVCNDMPGAEKAMVRAKKLWDAGEAGDPGWLNRGVAALDRGGSPARSATILGSAESGSARLYRSTPARPGARFFSAKVGVSIRFSAIRKNRPTALLKRLP